MENKLPLPTCLLINARSLRGKTEELTANLRHLHEYRTACVMAITETWLDSQVPSSEVEPDGYTAYRMDRDSSVTGKSRGGVKGAYSASPLPPLGASDHSVVQLRPAYQRLLEREKPQPHILAQRLADEFSVDGGLILWLLDFLSQRVQQVKVGLALLEMYCRELTKRFQDVWVVSGPLVLPREEESGKKMVSYQVIGKDGVAVPTHLFKAVLVRNNTDINNNRDSTDQSPASVLALGAFIVPNQPIGFDRPLTDFQVSLSELEKTSGLTLFPKLPNERLADLCEVDGCQLMSFKEFTLFLTGRKVHSARSMVKLEKFMSELREQDIQPDDYLNNLYLQKKKELANREEPEGKTGV
ncbi:LOW QUALITY PROTEIN: nuclease EXOG, mitochondrial-like [Diretmus argenteus]